MFGFNVKNAAASGKALLKAASLVVGAPTITYEGIMNFAAEHVVPQYSLFGPFGLYDFSPPNMDEFSTLVGDLEMPLGI